MCDLTTFITDYRLAAVKRADRFGQYQLLKNRALLTAPLKVFRAACGFGSDQAAINFVARSVASGNFTGEIGALTVTEQGEEIARLLSPPSPPTPLPVEERPNPRPFYPSDERRNERRREERNGSRNGAAYSASDSANTPPPATPDTPPHVHGGADRSNDIDSIDSFLDKNIDRSNDIESNEGGLGEKAEVVAESAAPLRMTPPLTLREELIDIGTLPDVASERARDPRARDALDELYFRETKGKVGSRDGYVARLLADPNWQLTSGARAHREQAKLTLLAVQETPRPPAPPPDPQKVAAWEREVEAMLEPGETREPPCQQSPPADMLAAAREELRRLAEEEQRERRAVG